MKNYGIHLPTINPLGPWTGGPDVDCGATNRKLGSDMGAWCHDRREVGFPLRAAELNLQQAVCTEQASAKG